MTTLNIRLDYKITFDSRNCFNLVLHGVRNYTVASDAMLTYVYKFYKSKMTHSSCMQ